jgi:hypothetical protein
MALKESNYAERHFAGWHIFYCNAECHYDERRYAGCRGTIPVIGNAI